MGWLETCAMDERMRFVMAIETHEEPFAAVCRRFGVSRRIGYKWIERYRAVGVAGLVDLSRAPRRHPNQLTNEIAERCLAVRQAHPSWGPVKVKEWLERRVPGPQWPAASTIGELFDREGLTVKRRLRPLLRSARKHDAYLHVDMEQYAYKDLTLEIFKDVLMEDEFRDVSDVGIVLQAYLPETERDYFFREVDAQVTFKTAAQGKASELILHQNGKDMPAQRAN